MGAGTVGCCDNNTAHKNSEVSIQSVTYREASEDCCLSPTLLHLPKSESYFALSDQARRIRKLEKLKGQKQLILSILNTNGLSLKISPSGLENSPRGIPDGYVFFGCKLRQNNQIVNDYKFKIGKKIAEFTGRCFLIYFKIETKSFWLKDLGKGPGVFIKLDYPLVMKDGIVFNIGNCFLTFSFKNKQMNNEVIIRKLGDNNYTVELASIDCLKGVCIGRGRACKVRIKDESLSKTHALLKFNLASGWILQDGDFNGAASTNGTWLYASEEFEIYENMFFKTCQTTFKAGFSK